MPDGGLFAAELYERHAEPLMRLAVHLAGGDRHCAEDLAQETILRAWQHRDMIRPGQERAWLAVTARHLAIDGYRRGHAPHARAALSACLAGPAAPPAPPVAPPVAVPWARALWLRGWACPSAGASRWGCAGPATPASRCWSWSAGRLP